MRNGMIVAMVTLIVAATFAPALAVERDEAPSSTPPTARAHLEQGVDYGRRGRWDLAVASYREAVRMQPSFVEAWSNLGHAYRKLKQYPQALDAYQRALALRPDYAPAHEYIGRAYVAMGNRERAMEHYETLNRLDPQLARGLLRAIQTNDPDAEDRY